ncbi:MULTISPECIES: sialidase family protein [Flavobacteriaceae]|uniref:sialidase family protein n=1 Tax=Flavobacteriaceae TaxID=49546 RepID=UPI001493216F|nr:MULTISPECIES: sialidase family protein [Allomuricauda]MDC6366252.1 exo-alpha-sialidase [Muricauda sp. AC10]
MKFITRMMLFFFLVLSISCQKNITVKVLSEKMVYDHPPFSECHASTIEEVGAGKLMVSAFGGTKEGNKDVCIWLSASSTDGQWLPPKKMADGIINDSLRHPTWNPVLFKSDSGKLSLFYKVGPSPREWWGMVRDSDDDGKTWGKPQMLPKGILGPIKNKPIQLEDGTILSPTSTESLDAKIWRSAIEVSKNDGKTWAKHDFPSNDTEKVIQPTLLLMPNGDIKALMRSNQDVIMESNSNDQGNTWSKVTRGKLLNPNSGIDAVNLEEGGYLLVYNPLVKGGHWSNGRNKLSLAYSKDGVAWEDILVLEDHEKGEFSYPAIIQAQDGKIHVTYTYNRINVKHLILEFL